MARPKEYSNVTVTFKDGEVKTYLISAGPGVGGYLAREASACGVLSLFNGEQSFGVPLDNIRDWQIEATAPPEANEAPEPVESDDG